VLLRMREGGCDAALADWLAIDHRRQVSFALSVYWKLELALPVSLFYHQKQSDLGAAMDEGANRHRASSRSKSEGKVLC